MVELAWTGLDVGVRTSRRRELAGMAGSRSRCRFRAPCGRGWTGSSGRSPRCWMLWGLSGPSP